MTLWWDSDCVALGCLFFPKVPPTLSGIVHNPAIFVCVVQLGRVII